MDRKAECYTFHLIDGDGNFNAHRLHTFIKQAKLGECGVSYAVVAIMGRQSSGKSTLLNHLFHTDFMEMNADIGRSQTTKGIWMAMCAGIAPCTIVMDLEGSDGRERGQDDTTFERQSALFALAVSDILLINMWCHDIGCEQAANKPLLKIVFEVMLRLFPPRKTTLMFVIRDKTRTPLESLERVLREDIQKIWDGIPKPQAHKQAPLSNFFNVEVVALSSYEEKKDQFEEQVSSLRTKFNHSIAPGGLAGDRQGVVPASGFSLSAQQIWKVIKENKDLDLPAHKVMVAMIRCEEIANEKFSSFAANKDWLKLEKDVQFNLVPCFGKKLRSLIGNCLSSYDKEAAHFEESSRSAKRNQLEEKLTTLVQPTYQMVLEHIRSQTMETFKKALINDLNEGQGFATAARYCTQKFKTQFDEQCQDAAINQANGVLDKVRDKFSSDFDSHMAEVRTAKLGELTALYKSKLEEALCVQVGGLLEGGNDDTWPGIREVRRHETEKAVSEFSSALCAFEMDEDVNKDMILKLKTFARELVEGKAKEEASKVLLRLKDRFIFVFNHDDDKKIRVWTESEDIQAITEIAKSSSLKLLSVLAAIRLDEDTDTIWDTLVLALGNTEGTENLLTSNAWEKVPVTMTLITPVQCKQHWNEFEEQTKFTITQAIKSQNANKKKNKRHPFYIAAKELGRGFLGYTEGADSY